jgi:signal transduction histidine kinase
VFAAELTAIVIFASQNTDNSQDAVAVNEVVQSVQNDWEKIEFHQNNTRLDYTVLNSDGDLLFQTKSGLSNSINTAIIHRDTILNIEMNGSNVGQIIIYNDSYNALQSRKHAIVIVLLAALFMQCAICVIYSVYLNCTVIKPFRKLREFAERVAGGNLDIPLEMDRHNLFGAFTESFDIMRSELKKARLAEAEANAGKKELVAKLSHDIKTPVASIKAAAEVGEALADNVKIKENYRQIICKTDHINTLVNNLFTATLEELTQLSVTPADMESTELKSLIENSDYLHRAAIPDIPDCLLFADKLRLQQVLDNIFANSYKYANTAIDVTVCLNDNQLAIAVEDYGGGVSANELPLLKEKFKRGSNTNNIDGAGLGLYISDYFMREMSGRLVVENGKNGLKVTLILIFSNSIYDKPSSKYQGKPDTQAHA